MNEWRFIGLANRRLQVTSLLAPLQDFTSYRSPGAYLPRAISSEPRVPPIVIHSGCVGSPAALQYRLLAVGRRRNCAARDRCQKCTAYVHRAATSGRLPLPHSPGKQQPVSWFKPPDTCCHHELCHSMSSRATWSGAEQCVLRLSWAFATPCPVGRPQRLRRMCLHTCCWND